MITKMSVMPARAETQGVDVAADGCSFTWRRRSSMNMFCFKFDLLAANFQTKLDVDRPMGQDIKEAPDWHSMCSQRCVRIFKPTALHPARASFMHCADADPLTSPQPEQALRPPCKSQVQQTSRVHGSVRRNPNAHLTPWF